MKPDLEDYEELNAGTEAPRSRAMSWLVLVVAVGGFAALAYYAYHSGTNGTDNNGMMVVQADQSPIKEIPADKGGEEFANKDKTIYDVITPGSAANSNQAKVEKLMPDPERPVTVHEMGDEDSGSMSNADEAKPAAPSAPSTTTFVNKSLEKPASSDGAIERKPPPQVVTIPQSAPAPTTAPAPTVVASATPPASPATAAGAPTMVNEVPVASKATPVAEAKKPAPVKATATPAKKLATATTGSATIQLGAFKSEDEAQGQWKKIAAKNSSVLTGSPTIVKADLPNGTFYRLRTNVASAKDACAALSAKGQACFAVK